MSPAVPWARPGSGFTELFEAMVVTLCAQMPVRAVAHMLGVGDDALWRILHHYVDGVRAEEDHRTVTAVGIDETAAHRGQRYIAGLARHLPGAEVTFDGFYVIQLANAAVDEVRRAEVRRGPILKNSRWVWLKDGRRWYSWARRCRLELFKRLALTIKAHWNDILNAFDSRLSNGGVEAANGLIQATKARARGYRTTRNLITMTYLIGARLTRLPASPYATTYRERAA